MYRLEGSKLDHEAVKALADAVQQMTSLQHLK